ncbi:MAG: GHKL domain-containing protein [Allomuricauda sp.]
MNLKKELYHPKSNKARVLCSIKSKGYHDFLKNLSKLKSHPSVKAYVEGNLFPKSYNKLSGKNNLYITDNLGGELGWMVYSILNNAKSINYFIEHKRKFEREVLLGRFENASGILDIIEKDISLSYWCLECRFAIYEYSNGTEANWKFLNKIVSESQEDPITSFYAEWYSKKAESKITYNRYARSLSYDTTNLEQGIKEYLFFKFGFFQLDGYSEYISFLIRESTYSLIDRYETLIKILFDFISQYGTDNFNLATCVLKDLNGLIFDERIDRIKEIAFGELNNTNINEEISIYLESYTKGNYKFCKEKFVEIIEQHPEYIELYEPYIKSCIELNDYTNDNDLPREIKETIKNLIEIYSHSDGFENASENILKKITVFQNLSAYNQLLGLVSFSKLIPNQFRLIENLIFLNSKFSNPLWYSLKPKNQELNYSGEKLLFYEVNKDISQGTFEVEKYLNLIPNKKSALYEIRSSIYGEFFDKCLYQINEFKTKFDLTVLEEFELFNLEYSCLLEKKSFSEAVVLLGRMLQNSKSICSLIDIDAFYKHLVDSDLDGIKGSIELVILFDNANASSYFKFVALDELFMDLNIDYPHQLFEKINQENERSIVYILENVCTVNVLGNFLVYNSREEVIIEREKILLRLVELRPENEDEYVSEIARLQRLEKIKNVIREVNDGRIYINVQSLDKAQKQNYRNSFDRLLVLSDFAEEFNLLVLDSSGQIEKFYHEINDLEDLRKNAAFTSCKSLLNEFINNFLYSEEYGLDGCLSTRIRHGALENIIRGAFESHGLIAKKIDDDYIDIKQWQNEGNHLDEQTHLSIQKTLKSFSNKIDNLIKFLINDKVQIYSIKSKEKPTALFNYYFPDKVHAVLYSDIRNGHISTYEALVNNVFDLLKAHTSSLLEDARKFFKTEVKNILDLYLDELNTEVLSILESESFPQLTNAIKTANTRIQNEIEENVSEWFKFSEDSYQNLLDFESIINTSLSLTNNPKFQPKIVCDSELGVYGYLHFVFIFRILFDNIIKHSGLLPENVDTNIEVKLNESEKSLIIKIENKIAKNVDIENLNKTFLKVRNQWSTKLPDQSLINREGGSGLEKIKRILIYDLGSEKTTFNFNLKKNRLEVIIGIPFSYSSKAS